MSLITNVKLSAIEQENYTVTITLTDTSDGRVEAITLPTQEALDTIVDFLCFDAPGPAFKKHFPFWC